MKRLNRISLWWIAGATAWSSSPGLAGSPPESVRINEIRIDQLGTDNDEYFEIAGPPGTPLAGLSYLVVGDSAGAGTGVVEVVIDLTGVIGPSGYHVVAETTFSLGSTDLTTVLNFENGDNVTHLLVEGFTGAVGVDLDVDEDCVMDSTPWVQVLDQVVLLHTTAAPPVDADCHYGGPVIGPVAKAVPSHVYRCFNDFDHWEPGTDDATAGFDSPGADNPACAADCTCDDDDPPALDHEAMLAGGTVAEGPIVYSGYVDPRWESTDSLTANQGLSRLTVVFTEPVFDIGGCAAELLTPAAFEVRSTAESAPVAVALDTSDHVHVSVLFDRIIPLQQWTTVIAHVEDACGNPITSEGDRGPGVWEPDRLDVAFLPGDIDQSGAVQNVDLLRFNQYVQQELTGAGICTTCPHRDVGGLAVDYYDTDRSGVIDPLDVLRYRQLLSGSGAATQSWSSPPHSVLLSAQP